MTIRWREDDGGVIGLTRIWSGRSDAQSVGGGSQRLRITERSFASSESLTRLDDEKYATLKMTLLLQAFAGEH
jgi:hypothetical protein